MSDDDSPDNVLQMPRIGSPPPPPVPPSPTLNGASQPPDAAPGVVRVSAFDAPAVPHAPSTVGSVPAALRSDGVAPAAPDPHGLPPRTGALSLAAVLAIALAAFEGLQTWLQEAGPRRAEAAKHEREMDLLAAKARADAARLGAEADKEHARARVPSSHAYGRSALGRGAGGPGRAGGGVGPGRSGSGRTAPSGASAQGRSTGAGGRAPGGRAGLGSSGSPAGAGRNGGSSGRNGAGGTRNGPSQDRNGGLRGRNGGTGGGRAGGSGNTAGSGTRGAGAAGGARGPAPGTDGKGRRSPRQAVADWWRKGKKSAGGSGGSGASGGPGATTGPKPSRGGSGTAASGGRGPVKGGPTFWDDLKNRVGAGGRSKPSRSTDGIPPNHGTGKPPTVGGATGSSSQDRVHLKDAAWEAVNDRWKKRRDAWTADASERRRGKNDARDGGKSGSGWRRKADSGGRRKQDHAPRGGEPGPHGYDQPRSSPFDQGPEGPVTITVEQVDPPGTHAKRWEPTAIAPSRQALPKQAAPVLPRAPQRPAGPRPGTTRRKEPIPMPPAPTPAARTAAPAAAAGGALASQHATDISLGKALQVLTALTTDGMETYDDAVALAGRARRLLAELEQMTDDLERTHNVSGPRTKRAIAGLMESVSEMTATVERLAQAALDAAERAEAEETAMARDYRPTQDATADAGLHTPSARIHNEN
ncbi:hypothetical protein [Streptomyces sp. WAC 04229]|uniref:hypothetical protein n=1 Tax=Streptomyces sp. WAC 04229 TaxID=2203206 RepID=UPI000F73F350|nr:hypothetical protein [Streptomyces sp. WAC 04229]